MKLKLNALIEWLIILFLSCMLLSVLWGVFSRYVLADQSSWTDELARFMLIWVSILGAVYVSGKNAHITIDLLPDSITYKNKQKIDVLTTSLILLFVVGVFIIGGFRYMFISFKLEQTSAALGIPVGIVYSILPLAGIFIVYYKLSHLKKCFKNIKQKG